MANPELELQKAIVDRLKADSAVTALVNGRIYDDVPAGVPFPYVNIGPVDSVADDADCITGLIVAQQVDCWSRYANGGTVEAKKIVDAVRAALHDQEALMPLPTNGMVFLECRNARVNRDPDGLTAHGILSFEASVQRN